MFISKLRSRITISTAIGYGLFLALCASSTWMGAQSYYTDMQQLPGFSWALLLATNISMICTYTVFALCSYCLPIIMKKLSMLAIAFLYIGGQTLVIAATAFPKTTTILITTGVSLSCIGASGFFCLWQQVFASQKTGKCETNVIAGTMMSSVFYFILRAIPDTVTLVLIPFVLVPIACLLLYKARQDVDYSSPMFVDVPRHNRRTYHALRRGFWRSALCVGIFLFINGVLHIAVLVGEPQEVSVYPLSMLGAFLVALAFLLVCTIRSFRIDIIASFRTLFPIVVSCLILITLIPDPYTMFLDSFTHSLSVLATMIITIQCAQVSRDNGINPTFVICLYNLVMLTFSNAGSLVGYTISSTASSLLTQQALVAMISVWLMGIVLYLVRGRINTEGLFMGEGSHMSSIEFLELDSVQAASPSSSSSRPSKSESDAIQRDLSKVMPKGDTEVCKEGAPSRVGLRITNRIARNTEDNIVLLDREGVPLVDLGGISYPVHYRDRLSKQCAQIVDRYRLTARESEVFELMARGNSLPRIAEMLFISENTVRFHRGHIYGKTGVHKRNELIELVNSITFGEEQ